MLAHLIAAAALAGLFASPPPPPPRPDDVEALRAEIGAIRKKAADEHVEKVRAGLAKHAKDAAGLDAFIASDIAPASEAWLERQASYLADLDAEALASIKAREEQGVFVEPRIAPYARPWLEGLPAKHLPAVTLVELRCGLGRWILGLDQKTGEAFGLAAHADVTKLQDRLAPVHDQQAAGEVFKLLWSILDPPFDRPPPDLKIVPIPQIGGFAVNAELIKMGFRSEDRTLQVWAMGTDKDGRVTGFVVRTKEAPPIETPEEKAARRRKERGKSDKPRSIPHVPKKDGGGGGGGG